eukprot:scaffold57011_cov18-Tisochrysis_lutea.AAC.1
MYTHTRRGTPPPAAPAVWPPLSIRCLRPIAPCNAASRLHSLQAAPPAPMGHGGAVAFCEALHCPCSVPAFAQSSALRLVLSRPSLA